MSYLNTLRRIPDDIILSMATRPITLREPYECVCGWAFRELEARRQNVDASEVSGRGVVHNLCEAWGGDYWSDWGRVNGAWGSEEATMALEEAFADRVSECVP